MMVEKESGNPYCPTLYKFPSPFPTCTLPIRVDDSVLCPVDEGGKSSKFQWSDRVSLSLMYDEVVKANQGFV